MYNQIAKVFTIIGLLLSIPVLAHHSFTAEFDINRPVKIKGKVTRIEWTNPHAWFYMDVEGEAGNNKPWAIELLGLNNLLRQGWTRDKIKPGDTLIVEGFGARNGTLTANASVVIDAESGEQIWGSPAGQQDQ